MYLNRKILRQLQRHPRTLSHVSRNTHSVTNIVHCEQTPHFFTIARCPIMKSSRRNLGSPILILKLIVLIFLAIYIMDLFSIVNQLHLLEVQSKKQSSDRKHRSKDDGFNNNKVDSEDGESFSACVLILDENHRLSEWIAYHYFAMRLRYLVVAVDPHSKTSPSRILNRWRDRMTVVEWTDSNFIDKSLINLNTDGHIKKTMKHRARQTDFYLECTRHLQNHNRSWTSYHGMFRISLLLCLLLQLCRRKICEYLIPCSTSTFSLAIKMWMNSSQSMRTLLHMRKTSFVDPEAFSGWSRSTRNQTTAQITQSLKKKLGVPTTPSFGKGTFSRAVAYHFLESFMALWRARMKRSLKVSLPFLCRTPSSLTLFGGVIEQQRLEERAMAVSTDPPMKCGIYPTLLDECRFFAFLSWIISRTDETAPSRTL
jgi:hypothetical protein